MEQRIDEFLKEFKKNEDRYKKCCGKLETLINEILESSDMQVHGVYVRLKSSESIKRKIELKNFKYVSLAEITDIVGVRIVTYLESDVDKVSEILKKEFDVDEENSVDKREVPVNQFGYSSLHVVAGLTSQRFALKEYTIIKDLKFEIQIRSILQHAWAEIEHKLGYKSEVQLPKVASRNFSRIAALLEMADLQFNELSLTLNAYAESIEKKEKEELQDFPLDKITFQSFLKYNSKYVEIDEKICSLQNATYDNFFMIQDVILERLQFIQVLTVSELQNQLEEHSEAIVEVARILSGNNKGSGKVFRGTSLFFLVYIILCKNYNIGTYAVFCRTFFHESIFQDSMNMLTKVKMYLDENTG